jgi:hypothetical protein
LAVLPEIVLADSVSCPPVLMAPPEAAFEFVIAVPAIVSGALPSRIAPPSPLVDPWVSVRPDTVTAPLPDAMLKMREASLPEIVSASRPGPVIERVWSLSPMGSSPWVRVIGLVTAGANVMTSSSPLVLDSVVASRSVQFESQRPSGAASLLCVTRKSCACAAPGISSAAPTTPAASSRRRRSSACRCARAMRRACARRMDRGDISASLCSWTVACPAGAGRYKVNLTTIRRFSARPFLVLFDDVRS